MKKTIKTSVMDRASAVDVAAAQRQPAADGAVSVLPAYQAVVGLDVGDRQSHYCVLDLSGGVVAEGGVKTRKRRCGCCSRGRGECASPWKRARIRRGSADCCWRWAMRCWWRIRGSSG